MIVRVRLFAVARQLAGAEWIELDVSDAPTVAVLRGALLARLPALEPMRASLRFAVNNEYANDSTVVPGNAEVACIPPVSGG